MADFRLLNQQVEGTFDVVLSFDNSLPHLLTEDDTLQALVAMKKKLNPDGLLLISLRDYDAALADKPKATMPTVMQIDGQKRIYFQTWDWQEDQPIYTTTLFVLKQQGDGWTTTSAKTKYRALDKKTLLRLMNQAGYSDTQWLEPKDSGFYQPVVVATQE